jgi:flagellar basal body rod protein FlgC
VSLSLTNVKSSKLHVTVKCNDVTDMCTVKYLYGRKAGADFCLEYLAYGSKYCEVYITVRRIQHDSTPVPLSHTPPHPHADASKRVASSVT